MKLGELYPKRFLSGADLKAPVSIIIEALQCESVYRQSEGGNVPVYVLYAQRGTKGVILTKSLAMDIAAITGEDDTDNWVGRRITLYPKPVTVAGRNLVSIRARKDGV